MDDSRRTDPRALRLRLEAAAGFLLFWTAVVGGLAAWRIAIGHPSVGASFLLLVLVIADVAIWRRWRRLR